MERSTELSIICPTPQGLEEWRESDTNALRPLGFPHSLLQSPSSSSAACTSLNTSSATPQLNSTPLPASPYAWAILRLPQGSVSNSRRIPPCLAGRSPTISRITSNWPCLFKIEGYSFAAFLSNCSRTARDGSGLQSLGCFVPPTMVPPFKGRGMRNDQVPSASCCVMVLSQGFETRHVCPGIRRSLV
ncbi:hypothetical protein I7I53_02288 [Histoplasma capsulatum var. duboisii H88]|uniref:Uncharacterized protein n=1 Tax=Ajellomyces capsulatus (strain H88) TaxID=544711 RepID=A0A8A1LRN9_AJEC8|nr:hypothetical protein I7I53_02288 [Histoplasma capsulatum var. duboisii H88]